MENLMENLHPVIGGKPDLDTKLGFSSYFDAAGELDTLPSALILWRDLKVTHDNERDAD